MPNFRTIGQLFLELRPPKKITHKIGLDRYIAKKVSDTFLERAPSNTIHWTYNKLITMNYAFL